VIVNDNFSEFGGYPNAIKVMDNTEPRIATMLYPGVENKREALISGDKVILCSVLHGNMQSLTEMIKPYALYMHIVTESK
jgi:hypothetical protein